MSAYHFIGVAAAWGMLLAFALVAFLLTGATPFATAAPSDQAKDWLGIDKETVADIVRDPTGSPAVDRGPRARGGANPPRYRRENGTAR